MKKYELTTDTRVVFGRKLFRIKALMSFGKEKDKIDVTANSIHATITEFFRYMGKGQECFGLYNKGAK